MNILAIDSATAACSVSLLINNNISTYFKLCPYQHAEYILPMINRILLSKKTNFKNLNVLAYSYGPGNFTGIRIGINVIQGLSLGTNLPIIGISTMAALAQSAFRIINCKNILVIMDASKKKTYFAKYRVNKHKILLGQKTEKLILSKDIQKYISCLSGRWVIVGKNSLNNKILKNKKIIKSNLITSNAKDIISLAKIKIQKGKIKKIENTKLRYLYNTMI